MWQILFIFSTLVIYKDAICQQIDSTFLKQKIIYVETGFHYSHLFGQHYIPYDYSTPNIATVSSEFAGFTIKPLPSIQLGAFYSYNFYKKMIFQSGLIFFNERKNLYGNVDSIIKFKMMNQYPGIYISNSVINYSFITTKLEIPLLIGYHTKRIVISGGFKIIPLFYNYTMKEFLNGEKTESYELKRIDSHISVTSYIDRFFKVNYLFKIKRFPSYFSISASRRTRRFYDFEFGIGLNLH